MDDEQPEIPEGEIYDLSPLPEGININTAAHLACLMAMVRGTPVRFRFNFAMVVVENGVSPQEVVDAYHAMVLKNKDQIEASPRFKAFKAMREAEKKQTN